MKRLAVWGAGGHGLSVATAAELSGWRVSAVLDDNEALDGGVMSGLQAPVLIMSARRYLGRPASDRLPAVDAVAFGIGDPLARQACALRRGDLPAAIIRHPVSSIDPSSTLCTGAVVLAGAVINALAFIGDFAIVNSGAVVEHHCRIEAFVHVAPNATLCGGVRVGEAAWIGAGATILEGITVGSGAMVGAGAVVTRDVPPQAQVRGVPAQAVGRGPGALRPGVGGE